MCNWLKVVEPEEKIMKRVLACILALVLLVTMIPMSPITAYAGDVTSDNFTFTSIDGGSVYIKPYQSEVTVLVFGVCYSTNTEDLLNTIANSDWVNCSEIRTVYIECSNEYCSSKTVVQDFANSIDDSNIIYCYDSSSGRMESYNALVHYLENTSGGGIEVMLPIVVILDEYNHIKDVSQDVMSARNIIKKISSFTTANYTKSFANVNISGQENYDYAYEVLDQLNKLRNDQNLSALTMDENLLDAAMQRAAEISVYFSHTRPNGEDCLTILEYLPSATRGENIAMKQTTPNSAMNSWINSPGHYANMINSEYQSVGIGCFKTLDGRLCWVQLFSSTSSNSIAKTGTRSVTKTIEISKSKMLLEADLSKESIIANCKDISQLNVILYHSDAQDGEFSKLDPSSFNYLSTNTSVASINDQGIITSQLNGSANVTASLKDASDISISKSISSSGGVNPDLKYGADRFSFGKDIVGYVGDEINTLVVYTSANENIASLDISSSNSSVVEIGTIKIGSGEYITGENECMATIPLKLKKKGNATITIVSPENVSTSITVSVEQVSYEIKMYSEIPTLVVGEGRTIGAALQLERNGTLVEDTCKYSFVSSNTEVLTVSNVRNENDGVYFYINGHKSGVAKLTITETNTGALYSTLVQVNDGIITYNAEALPTYYDRDAECNGFVNGMYMDEFSSTQKNDTTLSVSFNVYNTTSLVGVVDVYDENNNLVNTYPIKRYDGGIVSSVYETIKEGYYLIKDVVTGDILTYKQSSYSQKTEIKNIYVPIGGRIEITNDINYSDSCCILNVTELSITTILTVGDTIKGLSSSEIKKIAEESSVTIIKNEIGSKLPEIASEFRKKIIKSIAEDAGDVIVADALNIASDNALNIFESFDIDFTKLVVDSAASLGVGIAEDAFVAATAFIGATLKGMFIVADYLELSCFIMQIAIPRSDKAMKIYFDDENGCLVSNGVSIKVQDGTTDLSVSNFVMHSIVLSNEEDLTNEVKNSLDDISNDYVVRDIYLEQDGVVSQPGQTVQVYMPIPDNYDPNKCKLYWVKDDGALEQKEFTIVGNNIMFTTDHFSCWALVNENTFEGDNLLGDVNGDGAVDAGDAVIISRYDAGFITLTAEQLEAGDVNGDGAVDAGDAVIISRYDAGLISQIGY